MKRVLIIAGVIAGVLVVAALAAPLVRGPRTPAVATDTAADTAVVTRGSIEETVSATGTLAAEREITLAFASSGRVAEVAVVEGQNVRAGDVLARLDTSSLEWQVARARASLQTVASRLAQAKQPATSEELASAQASLDSAQANYDQVKAGPSAAELASARAALDSARASYDKVRAGPSAADLASAQAAVDSAEASLKQAQAAYDQIKGRPDAGMLPQALNLQTATIQYRQAKAAYDSALAHPTPSELAASNAQVAQADAQLAQLLDRPSASDLAGAASQVAQAQSQLAQLQARPGVEDVAVAQAQVDEAQVALSQAEAQLEDAVLTAPLDAIVVRVSVEAGEWATPGTPVAVLDDAGPLVLKMNIDEVDVAALAEGQTAHLRLSAFRGSAVTGAVRHIAPTATSVGGAQAYEVTLAFEPGDLAVRRGMTAEVDVVVAQAQDALLVPNRAIEADREAGRYYVTRQRTGGSTERLEVHIGLRDGSQTQLLDGVEEGDRLVLPTLDTPSTGQSGGSMMPFGGMGR